MPKGSKGKVERTSFSKTDKSTGLEGLLDYLVQYKIITLAGLHCFRITSNYRRSVLKSKEKLLKFFSQAGQKKKDHFLTILIVIILQTTLCQRVSNTIFSLSSPCIGI